jgi:hypothetical protein
MTPKKRLNTQKKRLIAPKNFFKIFWGKKNI